jgi:hypothetical protein
LKKTWFGDSNLDGEFNSSDFTSVFQAAQYEDGVVQNSTWSTGDWNGDHEFDSGDFILAFQSGGYENGPRPAIGNVPEPSAFLIFGLGLLWYWHASTLEGKKRHDENTASAEDNIQSDFITCWASIRDRNR